MTASNIPVLSLPPHFQIAFLQGIADGDGWTSIRTLEAGISTTTNQTLIDKIMTNLGIESKIYGNDVRIIKKKALEKKPAFIKQILAKGAQKAQLIAQKTIRQVKQKMGLT